MDDENFDMMFKIVLVGDQFVGKTNIMSKYLKNEFHEDSKSTVGVEFGSKQFIIENHKIKAQIWDTAGQERYKSITSAYYKGAKGVFVIYDISNKNSFDSIDSWVNDVKATADKRLTVVIIGNKCDLEEQRQVTTQEGEQKATKLEAAFFETSALLGQNLDKAFEMMIKEIYKKCHEELLAESDMDLFEGGEEINLNKQNNNEGKKSCC